MMHTLNEINSRDRGISCHLFILIQCSLDFDNMRIIKQLNCTALKLFLFMPGTHGEEGYPT